MQSSTWFLWLQTGPCHSYWKLMEPWRNGRGSAAEHLLPWSSGKQRTGILCFRCSHSIQTKANCLLPKWSSKGNRTVSDCSRPTHNVCVANNQAPNKLICDWFAWRPASERCKIGKTITICKIGKYAKKICKNMQKYANYAKNMHNMQCMCKNMPKICRIYAECMQHICQNMQKICQKYAKKFIKCIIKKNSEHVKICMKYAWNMQIKNALNMH